MGWTKQFTPVGLLAANHLHEVALQTKNDSTVFQTCHSPIQEGTPYDDKLMSCSATADGNVVVSGYSPGIWDDTTKYYNNIAAAKIDGNTGTTLWKFQVRALHYNKLRCYEGHHKSCLKDIEMRECSSVNEFRFHFPRLFYLPFHFLVCSISCDILVDV